MRKFLSKKYEREIINYDIMKLLTLSSLSREIHKFFAQLIVATMVFSELFCETLHRFRTGVYIQRYI